MKNGLRITLKMAAAYNLLWGAWIILFPHSFFSLTGIEELNHLFVWQGLGMVIGVYGLAYYWASFDYVRHWPIVAVGFLGKFLGPVGYLWNIMTADIPPAFGIALLPNDVIWWIPFLMMLQEARKAGWPLRS